jgi:menaquinone-dependent protoporphyrinogen oxidase
VRDVSAYDAVVVGSAVYANHWRKEAVKFLRTNADALARRPVWVFHSGPVGKDLDVDVPAPDAVRPLIERIDAHGPHTFAGALLPERAKGFITRKVANSELGGDYRDHDAIRAWADEVADALAVPAA